MAVLSAFGGHAAGGGTGNVGTGVVLGLLAGVSYAWYAWAGPQAHRARGRFAGRHGGRLWLRRARCSCPVLFATGAPLLSSWRAFGVGAYMALVPMFLGYVLFGLALRHVDATTATVLTLSEPVIAAGFAALIVGERLAGGGLAGVVLIGASLVLFALPARRPRLR